MDARTSISTLKKPNKQIGKRQKCRKWHLRENTIIFFLLENVGTTACREQLMEICLQSDIELLRSAEVTGICQHKSVFVTKSNPLNMNTLTVSDSSPQGVRSDTRNLGCCLLQITEVRHVMLCYTSKNCYKFLQITVLIM